MSFVGVSYRNIGEVEMTKRQLYFQSPPGLAWITSLEIWNLAHPTQPPGSSKDGRYVKCYKTWKSDGRIALYISFVL